MTLIVDDLRTALMSAAQLRPLPRRLRHQPPLLLQRQLLKNRLWSGILDVRRQWEQMGLGAFSGSLSQSQEERWSSYCQESFNRNLIQSKYLDEVVPRSLDSLDFRTTTKMDLDKPGEAQEKEELTREQLTQSGAARVKPASGW